jgi:hypothetical protein
MQKATASPTPRAASPAPKAAPAPASARAPARKPAKGKRNANLLTLMLVLGVVTALLAYAATRPRDPWVFDSPEAQSAKRSPRAM